MVKNPSEAQNPRPETEGWRSKSVFKPKQSVKTLCLCGKKPKQSAKKIVPHPVAQTPVGDLDQQNKNVSSNQDQKYEEKSNLQAMDSTPALAFIPVPLFHYRNQRPVPDHRNRNRQPGPAARRDHHPERHCREYAHRSGRPLLNCRRTNGHFSVLLRRLRDAGKNSRHGHRTEYYPRTGHQPAQGSNRQRRLLLRKGQGTHR